MRGTAKKCLLIVQRQDPPLKEDCKTKVRKNFSKKILQKNPVNTFFHFSFKIIRLKPKKKNRLTARFFNEFNIERRKRPVANKKFQKSKQLLP